MNLFILAEAGIGWRLALEEGTTALVAGMGTVFLVLIAISFVIGLLKYIKFGEITHVHKEARINVVVETKLPEVPVEQSIEPLLEQSITPTLDDLELVAAITAAIAATLDTTTDKLIVKSFRRINSKRGLSR
jgi:glutaconyl-CoA/methylmalonyl-CoA decarboxylase subunit delta